MTISNPKGEGAPGPSLLGTGEGESNCRSRQVTHPSQSQGLCPVHRGLMR